MVLVEFGTELVPFFREFLYFLYDNLSLIPFTLSFGAAVFVSVMFVASFVSGVIIRVLVIPVWVLTAITYFFPTFIPKEYEFTALVIFSGIIVVIFFIVRDFWKTRKKTQVDDVVSELVDRMKAQGVFIEEQLNEQTLQNLIKGVLRKNKLI
jgi:hypothetical protein